MTTIPLLLKIREGAKAVPGARSIVAYVSYLPHGLASIPLG